MKILTRYIFKEMIGPTLLGFAFYTSIIEMKTLFDLAGTIIRQSLSLGTVGKLLMLSLPHIIVLTVPMSLLFGILIAVGRLSADSEIIAMRALGISTRSIYRPVFFFSFAIFLLSLYLMNFVLPKGNRQLKSLQAEILTSMSEQQVRPRVFFDRYENLVIYVNDVDSRTGTWKGVFLADTRPEERAAAAAQNGTSAETATHTTPEQPSGSATLGRTGQKISVAESGNLSVIGANKQVWLNLHDAETHVWDPRKPDRYDYNQNHTQRVLLGDKQTMDTSRYAISFREMNLSELFYQIRLLRQTTDRVDYNLAWVEVHKKFSIPFACIAFGVLGLPLGITNRRGGKSSGFSLSIAIIVFYWVMINNGEALASAGKISPAVGMWAANVLLFAVGVYLLGRANRDTGAQRGEGNFFARGVRALVAVFRRRTTVEAAAEDERTILTRLDITFPNIIDRYVIRSFLQILFLVLLSTAALAIIVDYTEIAGDIRANHIPLHVVLSYYRFLIFQLLNWTIPISVLVATLVTFGIMSKNNEITAIKSGGVSLYRVAMPIVFIAAVISVMSYLLLDFVLPYSNQRVDAIKHRIQRGKEKASLSASQQKLWLVGKGRYLINFLSYDKTKEELTQVQIFEFHPTQFRITRRLYAQRARWNGRQWAFEKGWIRSFRDDGASTYSLFAQPLALYYKETPDDFATEARTADQMTFTQLRRYIETIRRAGYSAEKLAVQLWVKTSWPALSIVMSLIALPFAFKIGKRGALYGVGIALVLGIFYWMVFLAFTKFGEVGNLPPILSAWAANVLFAIAAVYMFLHVET